MDGIMMGIGFLNLLIIIGLTTYYKLNYWVENSWYWKYVDWKYDYDYFPYKDTNKYSWVGISDITTKSEEIKTKYNENILKNIIILTILCFIFTFFYENY